MVPLTITGKIRELLTKARGSEMSVLWLTDLLHDEGLVDKYGRGDESVKNTLRRLAARDEVVLAYGGSRGGIVSARIPYDIEKYAAPPTLIPIDLTKGDVHDHPDIDGEKVYLARIDGEFFAGRFSRQHFGWSFNGWHGVGLQFDTPGTNHSRWEALWEIGER